LPSTVLPQYGKRGKIPSVCKKTGEGYTGIPLEVSSNVNLLKSHRADGEKTNLSPQIRRERGGPSQEDIRRKKGLGVGLYIIENIYLLKKPFLSPKAKGRDG